MAKIIIIIAMILLCAGTCCGQNGPDTIEKVNLTRNFAMEMAIRKNIELKYDALNNRLAEIEVVRSRSIYDPVFNSTANGGISYLPGDPSSRSKNFSSSINLIQYLPTGGNVAATTQTGFTTFETDPDTSNTDWLSSLGLTLSQPLLRNAGRTITEFGITLAATNLEETLERFRSSNMNTVFSVINSYNRVYTLRQILETRLAVFTSAQNLLDEILKRENPGPLQVMETANAEYALAQRRKDLVDAERNLKDQETTLRYLIGMDSKMQIIPVDPPSPEEQRETDDQALRTALEFRPDMRQLRLTLKTTELQERIARHQTLPDLFFTASGGVSGTGTTIGNSYQQIGDHPSRFWTAGLSFSIPLGNTAAESDYRRSRIRTEQVKNQIESLSWRIRDDIETDMRALISARLQRQIAIQSRQIAELRLEEYRKNNRLGTATLQDVLNAENDLTAARNGQLDAFETFSNAIVRLWRDMGVLLERQGIVLEVEPEKRSGRMIIQDDGKSGNGKGEQYSLNLNPSGVGLKSQ